MRSRDRSLRWVAPILGLAALAACDDGQRPVVDRLIDEPSPPLLDVGSIGTPGELFTWSFADEQDLEDWRINGVDRLLRIEDRALVLESSGNDPRMERSVSLDAGTLDAMEVQIAGLIAGNLKLYWAGPGESFHESRSVRVPASRVRADGREPVTVPLVLEGHLAWRGPIRRLRLDPTDAPGVRVRLRGMSGRGIVISPERIEGLSGQARTVGLDDDYRAAWIARAGTMIQRRLELPGGGLLRVGYGVRCLGGNLPNPDSRFRFEVVARTRDSERVLIDRELSLESPSPDSSPAGWHDAEATLPTTGTGATDLIFRVDSSEGAPSNCMAAWASPVVVRRGREPERPNVVLISIDTLRSDRLGPEALREGLTPNIDAWARTRGVMFPNTVVAAPWTLPSHVSMFTGLDATTHGVNGNQAAPASLVMLAERLRDAGYTTAAFTGGGYMDPRFGMSQGFERYAVESGGVFGDENLETNVERFLDWLREPAVTPFFALLHTYEVHEPYTARQPYFDRIYSGPLGHRASDVGRVLQSPPAPERPVWTRPPEWRLAWHSDRDAPPSDELVDLAGALYDSGVAYVDELLGRLFRTLEESGRAEGAVVILTSDHGETLGEEGRVSHGYLSNDNLLVPLVIAAPGVLSGQVRHDRVRSVDIVPTILELLELPDADVDGTSLVPLLTGGSRSTDAAWSYSREWGISVRLPEGLEYLLDPVPWGPRRGYEALYRIRPGLPESRARTPLSRDTALFRRMAVEHLSALPGLWMQLENPGEARLSGTMEPSSGQIPFAETKAPGMTCPCLEPLPDGGLAFSAPPAGEYVARLGGHRMPALEIRGSVADSEFRFTLDPSEVGEPVTFTVDDDGTVRVDDATEGRTRFTFWSQARFAVDGAPLTLDPALRERLRALGYVR